MRMSKDHKIRSIISKGREKIEVMTVQMLQGLHVI